MKKILISILLLPATGFCYDKHKVLKLPVSRWREVKRMKPDSSSVLFADTLFISIQRKDSFSYRNGGGFLYKGVYSISEDSILDFGTVRYKIVTKRPDQLVLANEMGIYLLGVDLSDTARTVVIDSEKILPVGNIDLMIGHWSAYKHTTKEPGTTIADDKVIRAMYITGPSTDGKLGFILGGRDAANEPSWYIKGYSSDQTLDCAGKSARALKILKCQKGELILQEDDVTYYFKQFK